MAEERIERGIEGEVRLDERRAGADDEDDGFDAAGGGFIDGVLDEGLAGHGFSGADIESIVLSAKRTALTHSREVITRDDLDSAIKDFIPSAQGLEKEKQELAAVLECTSLSFLPEVWRARVTSPDGRTKLQERMAAIRRLIEE